MMRAHFHGGPNDGHECEAARLASEIVLTREGVRTAYHYHHVDDEGLRHYYVAAETERDR